MGNTCEDHRINSSVILRNVLYLFGETESFVSLALTHEARLGSQ